MRVSYRNPQADAWFESLLQNPAAFPFRFSYDGILIQGFPFPCLSRRRERNEDRESAEICFQKDESLYVTLQCAHDHDFGVSERSPAAFLSVSG